jgi:hypothetical protein
MATKTKTTKKPASTRTAAAKGKAVKAAKKPAEGRQGQARCQGRASGRHQDGPAAGLACRQGRFQRRALRGAGLAAAYVARGDQPAPRQRRTVAR